MRTFVYTDDSSDKFWNIDLQGTRFYVTFGKTGTKGQTQLKEFPDADKARKAYDKLIAEKIGKGYVETTPVSPVGRSLEEALAENPDDLAAHHAYADYLQEQGDPRGEFIAVQLALEEPGRSAAERKQLQTREAELLKAHAKTWLGDVGRFLVGKWSGPDKPFHFTFRRGWLDYVRMLPMPDAVLAVLAKCPEARLVSKLEVIYDMRYHPFDFDDFVSGPAKAMREDEGEYDEDAYFDSDLEGGEVFGPLGKAPCLKNLRSLMVGFGGEDELRHSTMVNPFPDSTGDNVIKLLANCPLLEEVYLNTPTRNVKKLFADPCLGQLSVLQYYFGTDYSERGKANIYPLKILAANASLNKLHTLKLYPGRDTQLLPGEVVALVRSPHLPALEHLRLGRVEEGDRLAGDLAKSGILGRLKTLDLSTGSMTDTGARKLAECPDLTHLERLDVSSNALTEAGIDALQRTGIVVVFANQHDIGNQDYLYEVDAE
jgi:uncharacterized protein (TIGR02996 family)